MIRAATIPSSDASQPRALWRDRWLQCLHIVPWIYLVFTAGCSAVYLTLVATNLTNDHLWNDFNLTSQTVIGDLVNSAPMLNGAANVFLGHAVVQKTYSVVSFMETNPAYPRRVILSPQPLYQVVESFRSATGMDGGIIFTQYCWVDLNRTFEMAHTAKRQMRCLQHYQTNAAMYMEPMLRNIPGGVNASKLSAAIHVSVLDAVRQTPVGTEWLDNLYKFKWGPVSAEVAFWQGYGVTCYISQAQNLYQQGLQDTMTIVNALNMVQEVTINQAEFLGRGLSLWTTGVASIGPWNDFNMCSHLGCSLVRGTPNSLDTFDVSYDLDILVGPVRSPNIDLVRQHIGPFGSIDLFLAPMPPELVAYFNSFQASLFSRLRQLEGRGVAMKNYHQRVDAVHPIPSSWRGLLFTGGNPLCQFASPQPFIQDSFGYYEACQDQQPLQVKLHINGVLFALRAAGPSEGATIAAACDLCTSDSATQRCVGILDETKTLFSDLGIPAMTEAQWTAMTALKLTLVQMASVPDTTSLVWLEQPLVARQDPWSLFGWVAIYDWLTGLREAYTFEGDEGTVTMMSPRHDPLSLAPKAHEVPQQACNYVWLLMVYSTGVVAVVAGVAACSRVAMPHATWLRASDKNLFQFNRVVGSVWIGRPILLFRGLTALMVLSTASLDLSTQTTLTGFRSAPRSWLVVAILAGEATWTTYVLNDVLLPLRSPAASQRNAPWSALLAWLVLVVVEVAWPVEAEIRVDRECVIRVLSYDASCKSGALHVGSFHRFVVLVGFQCGCCLVFFIVGAVCRRDQHKISAQGILPLVPTLPASSVPNLILPAVVVTHLSNISPAAPSSGWQLDGVGCVMAGMLPLGKTLFDLKLWLFYCPLSYQNGVYTLAPTALGHAAPLLVAPVVKLVSEDAPTRMTLRRLQIRAFVGLVYVVLSVVGSLSYLTLSKNAFSNDFLWSSLNVSGAFTYLSNWYNFNLQYAGSSRTELKLTSPVYGDAVYGYNGSDTTLFVASLYASKLQHQVSANLASVVRGLRQMDGCDVPWIFSPYCYVDFGRTWEMAATAARQARCLQTDRHNGAVYMEAVLRNVNWHDLTRCWGQSIEIGLFKYLRTSDAGQNWMATVQRNDLSVSDEVAVWHGHDIDQYLPQWQNFKSLGVIETFSIQNAVGISYPVTLKRSNGSFQLGVETTFKMYWGLASDLWVVASNSSGVGGLSLIRQSSAFAYANTTLRRAYLHNTSQFVLGRGLAAIESKFGPFGTIDMKRVPVPGSLVGVVQTATEMLRRVLTTNLKAQQDHAVAPRMTGYDVRPTAWDNVPFVAGNILCDVATVAYSMTLYAMFTMEGSCPYQTIDRVYTQPYAAIAAWAMRLPPNATASAHDVGDVCSREGVRRRQCVALLNHTARFVQTHLTVEERTTIRALAVATQPLVERVHLSQFIAEPRRGGVQVATTSIMNASDPTFEYFGWLYLIDWVRGNREVVSFQGDAVLATTTTLLSGYTPLVRGHVNAMEVPSNASFYIRSLVQYVSFVLFCVASMVSVLIVASRGNIEGFNMMLFNRVAGLVWVGRPLVLLRGLAAIALLSTSNLVLNRPTGDASLFAEPPDFWLTTIMSAGELTWLVYILNDTLSVVTTSHTAQYASKSSLLAWFASVVWTFLRPATHVVRLERVCEVVVVDFQVVCQAGVVEIGSYARFVSLIGLAGGVTAVCYVGERLAHRSTHQNPPPPSLFLYSSANHLFRRADWVHSNVYYLDKASAAIAGLLVVEFRHRLYMLDIKMWRIYCDDVATTRQRDGHMHPSAMYAIPLLE